MGEYYLYQTIIDKGGLKLSAWTQGTLLLNIYLLKLWSCRRWLAAYYREIKTTSRQILKTMEPVSQEWMGKYSTNNNDNKLFNQTNNNNNLFVMQIKYNHQHLDSCSIYRKRNRNFSNSILNNLGQNFRNNNFRNNNLAHMCWMNSEHIDIWIYQWKNITRVTHGLKQALRGSIDVRSNLLMGDNVQGEKKDPIGVKR